MMRIPRGPWPSASLAALLVYWCALALGTHLPGDALPPTPYSDKSLHFYAFGGLAFLLAWTWRTRRAWLPGGPLFAVLVATTYAALDEYTQTFTPGRYGDVVDWYYDAAGAIAGTAAFWALDLLAQRLTRDALNETQ
ncbi:MAG: VanZ family protein [Pirellulaceae bacterium]|jgi:VanZ family protein|nr:VanZ family protein [Pirellulaceae bacterium]